VDASAWTASSVVISALLAVGTLLVAMQTMAVTRSRARASAERAESAARLAVDNNDRLVAAISGLALGGAGASGATGVRWALTPTRGALFTLQNVGDASAYEVDVSAHPTMARFEVHDGDRAEVRKDEALTLFAVPAWQTTDRTITVKWREGADPANAEPRDWRYPLPSTP
jgi:hypothetical protein